MADNIYDFGSPEQKGTAPTSPRLHPPPHHRHNRQNSSISRSPTTIYRSSTVRRPSTAPSVQLPPSALDDRSGSPTRQRRESFLSRASTVASDASGIRYRKPERTNTITSYHKPDESHFQPGAEPGIDTSAASDVLPAHLANLQTNCDINIFDISLDEVRHTKAINSTLPSVLAEERDLELPCRWISVNGLSWDVIKCLGNKYSLHRLAIEDLLHPSTRTKVDWYADHAFVVLTLQKLVRLHQHRWGESRCDCPATEDLIPEDEDEDHKKLQAQQQGQGGQTWKRWWQQYREKQDDVLPRYLDRNMDGRIDMFVPAHSGTSEESPITSIRTLHRYESAQIPEHTAFMERHSVLAAEDLAVSVEQVSIFLMADNTVISFFEHSAGDVEDPIIKRLTSTETMLRRSCDASLMLQAIIDAIVDLAVPVKDAYNKTRKELQVDAMTNPDIRTSRALHIFGEEIDMLQNLFKPIVHLVNALRDHNSDAIPPPRLGNSPPRPEHDEKNQPKTQAKRTRDGEPMFNRTISDVQRAALKPRAVATSVAITPLAHTYFGDVLDHCITIIGALEQMDASASNISTLIFNTVGAKTNNFMMILAVVTVFFAPLTFISGYFGMNFAGGKGLLHAFSFFWVVAIPSLVGFMLVVFVTMLWDHIRDFLAKRGIRATRRSRRHGRR
ncbi:hypothetical protein B0A50_07592 [Salinomyces thailandicus]|uniref:Uncharacterized protein n=1 Tax=Salinomyces thailandicus TaxID=706561 RepID=A0A4V5N3D5_9PEZI|nr:hypothetical protein B0A50_07592 [Salinomyces thailandica]